MKHHFVYLFQATFGSWRLFQLNSSAKLKLAMLPWQPRTGTLQWIRYWKLQAKNSLPSPESASHWSQGEETPFKCSDFSNQDLLLHAYDGILRTNTFSSKVPHSMEDRHWKILSLNTDFSSLGFQDTRIYALGWKTEPSLPWLPHRTRPSQFSSDLSWLSGI